uniref:Uncharacterized protein n=1 Tax=Anas platyrhynchos platyrhynchos TaxID=8840 RepID=A0A493U1S6_ANAPP
MKGTLGGHFGDILGTAMGHLGATGGTPGRYQGDVKGTLRGHFGDILGTPWSDWGGAVTVSPPRVPAGCPAQLPAQPQLHHHGDALPRAHRRPPRLLRLQGGRGELGGSFGVFGDGDRGDNPMGGAARPPYHCHPPPPCPQLIKDCSGPVVLQSGRPALDVTCVDSTMEPRQVKRFWQLVPLAIKIYRAWKRR